ncbi:hypothetical protein BYT27DRAFT_7218441 [Phlegmacium glaucopus]|nr:hypothetical protein BYT27DRAFT_7218441 [Phlegmacium glaucopus]
MLPDLDNTYGAVFISVVVAAALYGVSCVQTLYYFTNQNDPWYIKLTVTLLMVLDTINQVAVTHLGVYLPNRNAPGAALIDVAITVYTFSITNWGNAAQPISVIFTGMTALIVQSFLTMRIWRLSGGNIYLAGSSLPHRQFCIAHFKDLASLTKIKRESISVNILGAATDLLIAAMLCTLLNLSRTGFRKSDTLINKLILFSVNTGLITSLFALASMVSILVAGNTFIYISFFFCLGRLYTNSLLSTLNVREMIRSGSHQGSVDMMSLSLRELPKKGSVQIPTLQNTLRMTRNFIKKFQGLPSTYYMVKKMMGKGCLNAKTPKSDPLVVFEPPGPRLVLFKPNLNQFSSGNVTKSSHKFLLRSVKLVLRGRRPESISDGFSWKEATAQAALNPADYPYKTRAAAWLLLMRARRK